MDKTPTIGGIEMKKLGKGKPGRMKNLIKRHLGDKAAEKVTKSDGAALVAKGKKTGNTDLVRKGSFIKNMMRDEAYDAGHDYADHTSKVTPGEKNYDPKYQGKKYKPAKPGSGKRVVEMQEKKQPDLAKTRQLARAGLVGKKDLSKFEVIMRKMERSQGDTGKLTTQERNFLASIYDDLLAKVIQDPSIFTRMRRSVKEDMNESLPPHLQKIIGKDGNIDPKKVSKHVYKGKKTPSGATVTDVTPKGYGPKESVDEKKLTPAEKKKREEIAQAMERDNPNMPMAKKMAIATAAAKRVAEDSHADGTMTKKTLKLAADAAMELDGMIGEMDDLPEWVQSKVTKAADYLDSARDYMKSKGDDGKAPVGESAQAWKKWQKSPAGKRYAALSPAEKEAKAERNRNEDIERTADIKMVKVKLPDGRVVMRKQRKEIKVGDTAPQQESIYKSPAHARLQKFMDKRKQQSDYWKKQGEKHTAAAKKTTTEEACCEECKYEHMITEAEYQGKSVKLNDPIRTSEVPTKKFKVYVKDPSTGNIKVVRFGDPGLSIKRDDPKRRKSFRARHNCDNPGPITGARYWSCYQWRSGAKVDN
jgi:hypothetical protein